MKSLLKMDSSYIKRLNRLNIQLCDVSLRDGIQAANPERYDTNKKKEIFHTIMKTHSPARIEVGSLSSPKVLPIMSDTLYLQKYAKNMINELYSCHLKPPTKTMVLVPSKSQLKTALEHELDGVAFISSVSEAFQLKNTQKTIKETKEDIREMCKITKKQSPNTYIKLYISCINECPLRGRIDDNIVVDEIVDYSKFTFDEICLSDTCGTLTYVSFKYILDNTLQLGICSSKISLHLHVFDEYREEIKNILYYCFQKGVHKFDVSALETGGCSVTMGHNVRPNLSYDLFYDVVDNYLRS